MRRFLFAAAALALLFTGVACTPEGVGDPCEPESCPPALDPDGNPITGVCGWENQEVYLEHFSLQCRTRVCMVFRADENWEPYCTRRCGPGAAIKGCGAKYKCMEVVTGSTAGAGCYCVHEDQLRLDMPGDPDNDKVAACK